jgi:uncharacterized phage protein (TIGR02220 family)
MTDSKGWISVHRKIQNHWLWQSKEPYDNLKAWLDILLTVNHSEQKVLIKGTLYTVKRGESIMSLDSWASRWKWNKSKVRRFLNLLQSDSMIELKNERKTTRLTVCNYDSYQDRRNANETHMKHIRNADETLATPNNNDNNDNNDNNENKGTYPTKVEPINFDVLLDYINEKTNKSRRIINPAVRAKYKARLKEGYTKKDIQIAIDNAVKTDFHKENGFKFLTPEFFSRADKIDLFSQTTEKEYVSPEQQYANNVMAEIERVKNLKK